MIVSVHKRHMKVILAVCDKNLVGKIFEEGEFQLNLNCSFYNKGHNLDKKHIAELCKVAHSINLVGEKSISMAKDLKLISDKDVRRIANIPYADVMILI